MRRSLFVGVTLISLSGIFTAVPHGSTPCVSTGVVEAPHASQAADLNADAMSALEKMGTYMRTLTAFQVRATTALDVVLDDGQMVTNDGTVDMIVRRPDRLRAEVVSDAHHVMFFYDGTSFSLWARRKDYYATVPAPPTLAELVEGLADRYGIEVPLVDLFYWGSEKSRVGDITSATDVGPSQVEGVTCEHLAFRQEGLDWQVWVQEGDFPLPRKLVLTTTTDAARPQYTSVLNWNLAPSFNDAAFAFEPPPTSHKIPLNEVRTSR